MAPLYIIKDTLQALAQVFNGYRPAGYLKQRVKRFQPTNVAPGKPGLDSLASPWVTYGKPSHSADGAEVPRLEIGRRLLALEQQVALDACQQQTTASTRYAPPTSPAPSIARTARMDVQQAIRNRLRQALAQGMTEHEFIRQLTPQLQKMGWWGRKIIVDRQGRAEVVSEGSPWRLKTIYRTNMAVAYNAARWKEQTETADSRPYWMYVAVMDGKTRAEHAAMHGRVFRHDDPIWQTHYPPCSFNCRCRVRALTEKQVARRGLVVERSDGRLETVTQDVGVDKRTGEVVQRPGTRYTAPDGRSMTPSPGWNYNPGQAFYQPDLERYDDDLGRQYIEGMLTGPAFARRWQHWEKRVAQLRKEQPEISDNAIRERFMAEAVKELYWPVAILSPGDRTLFGTTTKVVRLSDWTLAKQAVSRGGQEFDLKNYWRVQGVIERPTLIVRERSDLSLAYIRQGDSWLQAVIKVTEDRKELYLTTFRRTNEAAVEASIRRGVILLDER